MPVNVKFWLVNSEQRRQKPPHYRLAPPNWPNWAMGCALLMMPVASPARAANLADINAALADMRALSGQFVQSTPGGETCRAIFSRPARPLPIYLHARRTQCRDFARQLVGGAGVSGAEANRYPVSATPLRLLVDGRAPRIRPSQLESITEKGGSIEVALRDPKGDIPGRLVLIFDSETLALQGWRCLIYSNSAARYGCTMSSDMNACPKIISVLTIHSRGRRRMTAGNIPPKDPDEDAWQPDAKA